MKRPWDLLFSSRRMGSMTSGKIVGETTEPIRTTQLTVKEGEVWPPTLTLEPILGEALGPGFPRDPCPLQMGVGS